MPVEFTASERMSRFFRELTLTEQHKEDIRLAIGAGVPTVGSIPNPDIAVGAWEMRTSGSEVFLDFNIGGTIKSIALGEAL